jgi:hypothetical protein
VTCELLASVRVGAETRRPRFPLEYGLFDQPGVAGFPPDPASALYIRVVADRGAREKRAQRIDLIILFAFGGAASCSPTSRTAAMAASGNPLMRGMM